MPTQKLNRAWILLFYVCVMLLPGVLCLSFYNLFRGDFSISFYEQRYNLGIVLATFSFTMLGFLAAILAMLFVVVNTARFDKYRKDGFFSVLMILFFFVIFAHAVTFFSSLMLLSTSKFILVLIKITIAMAINNFVQVFIVTFSIVRLVLKSVSDG